VIPARVRNAPTFASLSVRNYRIYMSGQVVSLAGTWMQTVAQGILVVRLTDKGWVLGTVVAVQYLPVLVFGLYAGVLADRLPKRRLLVATQALSGLCALVLGLLVATDLVRLWMVFVMAAVLGFATAFDNPARQAFMSELVGPDQLVNAIGLNSVMMNLARIVGPGTAGILSATLGLAACFFFNAASFLVVMVALLCIRGSELRPSPRSTNPGQLREGLSYARHTPEVFVPLILMAVLGTLAYEFPVSQPILAKEVFGDADLYGTMSAVQGLGAIVGSLIVATKVTRSEPAALAKMSIVFGVLVLAVAAAPTLGLALLAIAVMGMASITFISIGNASLQLGADPMMRGRVMSLWSIAFIGSTTIGGPFTGWVADMFGARAGVGLGGVAAITAGIATYPALRRLSRPPDPLPHERAVGGILPSPPS
jgi:MFS family permease